MGRAFVSRGGTKLDHALEDLGIDVTGLRALDAGAATGGFTDCLLQRGARAVVSIDVAYGELAWTLRNDARVTVIERANVRHLEPGAIGDPVDIVVADLSFISLLTVADALLGALAPGGALVLLVKPQFELPRAQVPRGGVVREAEAWRRACRAVAQGYRGRGCIVAGASASALPGPKGNREFFLHMLLGGTDAGDGVIDRAIEQAP